MPNLPNHNILKLCNNYLPFLKDLQNLLINRYIIPIYSLLSYFITFTSVNNPSNKYLSPSISYRLIFFNATNFLVVVS